MNLLQELNNNNIIVFELGERLLPELPHTTTAAKNTNQHKTQPQCTIGEK